MRQYGNIGRGVRADPLHLVHAIKKKNLKSKDYRRAVHKTTTSIKSLILSKGRGLISGGVGRVRVDGVAPALGGGGVALKTAAAVSAEVVHVGGVLPVGVDGRVVVESALKKIAKINCG
jgi:hypothetical protein